MLILYSREVAPTNHFCKNQFQYLMPLFSIISLISHFGFKLAVNKGLFYQNCANFYQLDATISLECCFVYNKSPISLFMDRFEYFFLFDLEIRWVFQIQYCTLHQMTHWITK